MKKLLLVLLIPVLLTLTGCVSWQVKKAQERMNVTFNALIGSTEEDVVLKVGMPQNIQTVGELKVYSYHKSYGTRSDSYTNFYNGAYGSSSIWESYDKVDVMFKNGRVVSWKGDVQR